MPSLLKDIFFHLKVSGRGPAAPALSYLVQWSVSTAKAFKKLDDLQVELEFLLWIFWVAVGKHRADSRRNGNHLES